MEPTPSFTARHTIQRSIHPPHMNNRNPVVWGGQGAMKPAAAAAGGGGGLLVFLLLLRIELFSPQSTPTLPHNKFFINCGSGANFTDTRRTFVGDEHSEDPSFYLSAEGSFSLRHTAPSSAETSLYQTARIFRRRSCYVFQVDGGGDHLLRLHFKPPPSDASRQTDFSKALFNVSVAGTPLARNSSASRINVMEEYFISSLRAGWLAICFMPFPEQPPSFAYVNAIELFPASLNMSGGDAPHITPAGRIPSSKGPAWDVLRSVYRVNVGGRRIPPAEDLLWRTWVDTTGFVEDNRTVKVKVDYSAVVSDPYAAPPPVYQTAMELNRDDTDPSNFFNATWRFPVARSAAHLVRLHFCDIISTAENTLYFDLSIFNRFAREINAEDAGRPYHIDFSVDSDASGMLNISIGPRGDSTMKTAFLNGVEIMERMGRMVWTEPPPRGRKKQPHLSAILCSVIGSLALLALLALFYLLGKRAKQCHFVEIAHTGKPVSPCRRALVPSLNLGLRLSLAEIQSATDNFSDPLIIGHGGFGKVYRGTLWSGQAAAVKRSEPGLAQGVSEFQTEVQVLSGIRHRHLLSLIAYCDEGDEMVLVYEFMENGTLRDHLYSRTDSSPLLPWLSWKQRLEICIGAAKGLQYLHTGSAGGIIHRDVKSSNILLDERVVAKVADFGLSKSLSLDESHVSTSLKGSVGYFDPEYLRTQQLTEKSDVYSFGVVLLEVLCARPAIAPRLPREEICLADWGMHWLGRGLVDRIVDGSIRGEMDGSSLRKFGETVEKCLQECGAERPAMGDVVWDLEYALQLQQSGERRAVVAAEDDSCGWTDESSAVACPPLYPSTEGDELMIGRRAAAEDGDSTMLTTRVFSQLNVDDGR